MVYTNKFDLQVLVDGVPQKELANGEVHIPFGKQYSLKIANQHHKRAIANITIDGENVSAGGFLVPAFDTIVIERPVEKDSAFKFVSLDSSEAHSSGKHGENHDKVKGLIEVRFHLEKELSYRLCSGTPSQPVSVTNEPKVSDGCTVEGSATGQCFHHVSVDVESDFVLLKLFLRGIESEENRYCEGCGVLKTPDANYCGHCGRRHT